MTCTSISNEILSVTLFGWGAVDFGTDRHLTRDSDQTSNCFLVLNTRTPLASNYPVLQMSDNTNYIMLVRLELNHIWNPQVASESNPRIGGNTKAAIVLLQGIVSPQACTCYAESICRHYLVAFKKALCIWVLMTADSPVGQTTKLTGAAYMQTSFILILSLCWSYTCCWPHRLTPIVSLRRQVLVHFIPATRQTHAYMSIKFGPYPMAFRYLWRGSYSCPASSYLCFVSIFPALGNQPLGRSLLPKLGNSLSNSHSMCNTNPRGCLASVI